MYSSSLTLKTPTWACSQLAVLVWRYVSSILEIIRTKLTVGRSQKKESGNVDVTSEENSPKNQLPKTCAEKSGGPYSHSGFLPKSLPSHQKPAPQPPQHSATYGTSTNINVLGSTPDLSFSRLAEDQMRTFVMEMDVSTDTSISWDRHPSGSDHSTPVTHRTSNSSSSPHIADHPSPINVTQQQPSQSQSAFLSRPSPNLNPNIIPSNMSSFPSVADTSTSNPYAISSPWSYPPQQEQPQSQEGNAIPLASTSGANIDLLSFDINWSNIANEQNWNNWPS